MAIVLALGLTGCTRLDGTRSEGNGSASLPAPWSNLSSQVDRLEGLDEAELRHLLGQPAFERHEQPAQYWRYSMNDCVLDLYLYRESEDERMRVSYYEIRPAGRRLRAVYAECDALANRLGLPRRGEGLPAVEAH